jgi:hypothetical protein
MPGNLPLNAPGLPLPQPPNQPRWPAVPAALSSLEATMAPLQKDLERARGDMRCAATPRSRSCSTTSSATCRPPLIRLTLVRAAR